MRPQALSRVPRPTAPQPLPLAPVHEVRGAQARHVHWSASGAVATAVAARRRLLMRQLVQQGCVLGAGGRQLRAQLAPPPPQRLPLLACSER